MSIVYNSDIKVFCPIILLNMLGNLIEKVISNRLQVHFIALNFIYLNQLGSIKQHLIIDASIFLTHLIEMKWVKGLYTNTLVFDIVYFFTFLNHQFLLMILTKAGIDFKIFQFFSRCLINRQA